MHRFWVAAGLLFVAACDSQPGEAGSSTTPTGRVSSGTIAFTSYRGASADIYVVNADGTGLRRLTSDPSDEMQPAWSPDGTKIAYAAEPDIADAGGFEIWVMDADGSGRVRLTAGEEDIYPSWSPDGSRILFSREMTLNDWDLYSMNADGSDVSSLTHGDAADWGSTWTNTGKILFMRVPGSTVNVTDYGDVFSMHANASGLVRLTTGEDVSNYAISADGTRLAIHDAEHDRIVVVSPYQSLVQTTIVDDDFDVEFVRLAWSPNGESLALAGDFDQPIDLRVVGADGTGLRVVPNGYAASDPAWKPT